MRTIARDNGRRGANENLYIQPEGPRTGILQIQTNHVIKMGSTTPFHLPQSRNPGLGFQYAALMPDVVGFELVFQRGTWAHERHFSDQYVPKLRHFIETRLTQDSSDGSDPRIALYLERGRSAVPVLARNLASDVLTHVFLMDPAVAILFHGTEL